MVSLFNAIYSGLLNAFGGRTLVFTFIACFIFVLFYAVMALDFLVSITIASIPVMLMAVYMSFELGWFWGVMAVAFALIFYTSMTILFLRKL